MAQEKGEKKKEVVYRPRYGGLDSRGRKSRRREGKTDSWHPDALPDSDACDAGGEPTLNHDEQMLVNDIRRNS